jgi:HPt (histidine-containing phosphotransfer) domain-containing protein
VADNDAAEAPEPELGPRAFEELVRETGDDCACEIRNVVSTETDARLILLRPLSLDTERAKIGREAHSLKSAAGRFGYRRLADLARRIEQHANELSSGEYLYLLDEMMQPTPMGAHALACWSMIGDSRNQRSDSRSIVAGRVAGRFP